MTKAVCFELSLVVFSLDFARPILRRHHKTFFIILFVCVFCRKRLTSEPKKNNFVVSQQICYVRLEFQ